jgi:Flp pilus assembly pilin Flp
MGCIELVGRQRLAVALRGRIQRWLGRAATRRSGQSTVEYALVGALVVIAAAGAMALLGDQVSTVFGHITSTLSGAATSH